MATRRCGLCSLMMDDGGGLGFNFEDGINCQSYSAKLLGTHAWFKDREPLLAYDHSTTSGQCKLAVQPLSGIRLITTPPGGIDWCERFGLTFTHLTTVIH